MARTGTTLPGTPGTKGVLSMTLCTAARETGKFITAGS